MPLETGNYVSDLVPTNPTGTDPRRQGDDHMRLIKKVLQQTFPNVNGPVLATPDELNKTTDPTNFLPPGFVGMFAGFIEDIPSGWAFCDGTGTTSNGVAVPDLRGRMIIGADADAAGVYNVNNSGGSTEIVLPVATQKHTLTINEMPAHNHGTRFNNHNGVDNDGYGSGSGYKGVNGGFTTGDAGGNQGHSHALGALAAKANLPPYYALAYIIYL